MIDIATVYKIKKPLEELENLGFALIPEQSAAIKAIIQPLDSGTVNYSLNNFYNNPEWKKKIYQPNKKHFQKELGLYYDRKGNIKPNEKFTEILKTWFLQVEESEEFWLGLTSADQHDSNVFYGKKVLDTYCGEEIEELKKHDLIEEVYIED